MYKSRCLLCKKELFEDYRDRSRKASKIRAWQKMIDEQAALFNRMTIQDLVKQRKLCEDHVIVLTKHASSGMLKLLKQVDPNITPGVGEATGEVASDNAIMDFETDPLAGVRDKCPIPSPADNGITIKKTEELGISDVFNTPDVLGSVGEEKETNQELSDLKELPGLLNK